MLAEANRIVVDAVEDEFSGKIRVATGPNGHVELAPSDFYALFTVLPDDESGASDTAKMLERSAEAAANKL